VSQKTTHFTFDHNLGKCRPIHIIISPKIPDEILHIHIVKIPNLTLNMFLHYLVKLENYICCQFQWHILHVRPQNSSGKPWGRLNSSGPNHVTIKSGKQCSSA